jgi:hypothetical protein
MVQEARALKNIRARGRIIFYFSSIVHGPPAAIIDRAARADRPVITPPGDRLVRGFWALLYQRFAILFGRRPYPGPRSPRTHAAEQRHGARVPVRTRTRLVVPPPCRGPAVVAILWKFGVLTGGPSRPRGSGRRGGLGAKIARFLAQGTTAPHPAQPRRRGSRAALAIPWGPG